jgi:hypothetical protein
MTKQELDTKALEFFKDWSNYLLVTTVAAVGWVAGKEHADFYSERLRAGCIVALGVSIVFGILTLAVVPLVQEQRTSEQSNYEVDAAFATLFGWTGSCRLKSLCFPQHVFFLLAIFFYVVGTAWGKNPGFEAWAHLGIRAVAVLAAASVILVWYEAGGPVHVRRLHAQGEKQGGGGGAHSATIVPGE